jgi:hypothetical protein
MAGSFHSLPTREEELDLHRRLIDEDPVAPAVLLKTYIDPLIAALEAANEHWVRHLIEEAVGDALVSLVKNPTGFDASRSKAALPLFAYLRLAAQRDLQNILKKEQRHWQDRVSLESVEDSLLAGNYLGRDDPSERLQRQEEADKEREILSFVRRGLSDGEQEALELMRQGERKTTAFARVLGIDQLPNTTAHL